MILFHPFTGDVDIDHLVNVVSTRILFCKVTYSPLQLISIMWRRGVNILFVFKRSPTSFSILIFGGCIITVIQQLQKVVIS